MKVYYVIARLPFTGTFPLLPRPSQRKQVYQPPKLTSKRCGKSITRRGGEASWRRGDKLWEKRCEQSLVKVVTLRV